MSTGGPIKIVGFTGKIGAGKSWLTRQLCSKYGYAPVSFASALKEDLLNMGFSYSDLYVEKPEPIRKLMQVYGQARRYQDPNYWLHRGMGEAQALRALMHGAVVVFDDVRFINEADAIRDAGGVIIRVVRLDNPNPPSKDVSEIDMDTYPYDGIVTAGDSELEHLLQSTEELLARLGVTPWDSKS